MKRFNETLLKTVEGSKFDEKGLTKHYSRPLRSDVAFV